MSTERLVGAHGSRSSSSVVQRLEKLEKGFAILIFLLSTGALLPFLVQQGAAGAAQENNPVAQLFWLGAYVVAFLLIAARWASFMHIITRSRLLLLLLTLVGLALVSVLWSVAPGATLHTGIALIGTTLIGMYLGMRYSLGEQLRLLGWALGAAALLSLLFALALPAYGIASAEYQGSWQGVYDHKNTLGSTMTISATVILLLGLRNRRYQRAAWASFCGLSVGLLLLSNSITALIIFLALLVLLPLYSTLRAHYTLALPAFIVYISLIGSVVFWLLTNPETALNVFGRDLSLTGRTTLWDAVLEMIWRSPWIGYGYGAFWQGWEGPSATVWIATGYPHVHSHNGILDLWLALGLLGVLVFVLGFLMSFVRAIIWLRSTRGIEGLWPLIYLTFIFLYNFAESAILGYNDIWWILYVALAVTISVPRGRRSKTGHMETKAIVR